MLIFLATGYSLYLRVDHVVRNQTAKIALQSIDQAHYRLDGILSDYDRRSFMLLGNTTIQDAMLGRGASLFGDLNLENQVITYLSDTDYYKGDTLNIYLISADGSTIEYSNLNGSRALASADIATGGKRWYDLIQRAKGATYFFGVGRSLVDNKSDPARVFSFGRTIKDVTHGYRPIGVALFETNAATIQQVLDQANFNGTGETFIMNRGGKVIATGRTGAALTIPANLPALMRRRSGIVDSNGSAGQNVYLYYKLTLAPWTLVGVLPRYQLNRQSLSIGWYIMGMLAAVLLISILISSFVARYIQRPIITLLHAMRTVQGGDLRTRVSVKRTDEFRYIFAGFDAMIARLAELIDELYVQRLLEKEMQFKLLSSQMNTHFLYNTLNSVYWMARTGRSKEITDMVRSLSDYLQSALSDGDDELTVAELFRMIQQYVSIQNLRYRGKFSVTMSMDPSLKDYRLLKYIFQPLVENAIYHGLESKESGGKLTIIFRDYGECIDFIVEDNGVGMSEEKIMELRQVSMVETDGERGNFALKNIARQIRIRYGSEYSIDISSREGEGTRVTLRLPKVAARQNNAIRLP